MIDTSRFKLIWCPNCQSTKPIKTDIMPADGLNDHAAVDLLCDECKFIVATLHEGKQESQHG